MFSASAILGDKLRLPPLATKESDALASTPSDEFYMDAEFIPTSVAISGLPPSPASDKIVDKMGAGDVQWKPATEAMPETPLLVGPDVPPCDLACAGEIDDAWLAGAYALIATRPELLLHLFGSIDHLEKGIITLRLFKHGVWQPVTIDTMLPCRSDGRPCFIHASEGECLWPSLLTKALAKLHGSFNSLSGGMIADALVDLTAGHVSQSAVAMPDFPDEHAAYLDGIWKTLQKNAKKGVLMGIVATTKKPASAQEPPPAADGEEADAEAAATALLSGDESYGVLPGRLYPILHVKEPQAGMRLVCLRNPWVEVPAQGTSKVRPWSAESVEWERYPDVAEELLPLSDGVGKCMWMELKDLVLCSEQLISLTVAGSNTEAVVCEGTWHEATCGGPRNMPSWCINPQVCMHARDSPAAHSNATTLMLTRTALSVCLRSIG